VEFDFANDANVRVDTQLGIVYERTPSVTDDLNLINGIGVQMERELNELGVYRFKQVARWSDANVTEFARRLFCQKERIERDKWIPQAKRLVRTVYAACPEWAGNRPAADEMDAAIRLEFAGQKVRSDKDYGIVATERPARPDDLKEISGLSGKIEQELNACGIWRFAQIARWASTHVDALANRLQIPVDRIYRDQWIAKARRLAPLSAPPEASPAEPPRRATGTVAPRSTATVAPEPIVPAPAERPVVEPPAPRAVSPAAAPVPPPAKPDLGDTAIVIDPDLGAVYRDRPSKIDELQLIQGIGPALERRLHGYGVYRYRQIADWNRHQVEVYGDRLDVGERIHNEEWVRQAAELAEIVEAEESDDVFVAPARVDYTQVARQHFAGETGLRIDPRWGIVYDQKPERVDELRQIDGITPKLERALNRHGVYQFRQIAHWSDPTVAVFAEALALPKERIDRGKWIPQARRLELETDAGTPEWTNRASVEREPRVSVAEDFAGEDVEFDETYGVLYVAAPAQPDNLKLVKGIGTTFADRLNSVGVYKFKQIAHWTDANAEAFARLLSTKKQKIAQEGWIRQSITLDGGRRRVEPPHAERNPRPDSRQEEIVRRDLRGEDVVITPELGIIFRTPPREVDDLTKIRGIGTKVENSLNDHGVYQFRQVALWTRANAEEFSRRLEHFAGRMFREHWSDQARELHLEKYGTEL
jgi:predicted flap endonuclease-1-like 5' DNA nuclease